MTAPTLSQINLAREDAGLRSRVYLAAAILGHPEHQAAASYERILAVETTDDGESPTTIAGAYDYQWAQAIKSLSEGVPSRATVTHRLAQVGIDPNYITDGTVQRAVAAVLTTTTD